MCKLVVARVDVGTAVKIYFGILLPISEHLDLHVKHLTIVAGRHRMRKMLQK